MEPAERFDDSPTNPYSKDIAELIRAVQERLAQHDHQAVRTLMDAFHEMVRRDIELKRETMNSRIVALKTQSHSPDALLEVHRIIEEYFDTAAQRIFWSLPTPSRSEELFADFLERQKHADSDRWADVAATMGDDTVERILRGRVAHWMLVIRALVRDLRSDHPSMGVRPSTEGVPTAQRAISSGVEPAIAAEPPINPPLLPTKWSDLELRFISEERVIASAGMATENLNYAELGFEDKRSHKPTLAWGVLKKLAESGGTLKVGDGAWSNTERRIQEIRKTLRKRYRLEADPLPYVRREGYRTEFRIICNPFSYES